MDETKALPPLAHSVSGASRRLGDVPERLIYKLIETGELRSIKVGRRRLIPDVELQRLIDKKMAEAA